MTDRSPYNVLMKVLLCGDSRVGKTAFCQRLTTDIEDLKPMSQRYEPTIGLDLAIVRRKKVNGAETKMHIWDTSGDPRYRGIVKSYFGACCACFIMVHISNSYSIETASEWLTQVRDSKRNDNQRLKIIILGNRTNTEELSAIETYNDSRIDKLCKKENIPYHRLCVESNHGVWQAIDILIDTLNCSYLNYGTQVSGIHYLGTNNEHRPLLGSNSSRNTEAVRLDKCCTIL